MATRTISTRRCTKISAALASLTSSTIDCRENPILTSSEHNPGDYFNRKKFHSVKLQAVADSDCRFLDIFVGWPGKSHDARTFTESPIFVRLEAGKPLTPQYALLGDSAYTLKNDLIT